MIRNELERRNAEKQLSYLKAELEDRSDAEEQTEVTRGVVSALHMQISDIEEDVAEYEGLKDGRVFALKARNLDELGGLLIRGRIARGWSQADLARALDMETQQVQRYEKNDWQTASLWRLQEAAEALDLDVEVRARLGNAVVEAEAVWPLQPMSGAQIGDQMPEDLYWMGTPVPHPSSMRGYTPAEGIMSALSSYPTVFGGLHDAYNILPQVSKIMETSAMLYPLDEPNVVPGGMVIGIDKSQGGFAPGMRPSKRGLVENHG